MHTIIIPESNEKLAYLCGFLLGDGSIHIRKDKHDYCIKAAGNPKDEQEYYNKVIKQTLEELFNIEVPMKRYNKGTTYGFSVSSKKLVNYLTKELGMPKSPKYNTLHIPKVFYQEKKLLFACIRGIFDTDGCISFKKRGKTIPHYPVITISSKSSSFIKEIYKILLTEEIQGSIIIDYKLLDKRFKKGYNHISKIQISGHKKLDLWLQTIGTWHPKHQNKIIMFGRKETIRKI